MWFTKKLPHTPSSAVKVLEAENDLRCPFIPQIEENEQRWDRHKGIGPSTRRKGFALAAASALIAFSTLLILGMSVYNYEREIKPPSGCFNPPRRKEWRQLSDYKKAEYISAVKCLHELPSRLTGQGRLSDDFPYIHKHTVGIHYAAPFFPWHRYFLHIYEETLREFCGFRGQLPYWDWTLDWVDPDKSPIWDPVTGFGGDGRSGGDLSVRWGTCIADGPFVDYEVLWLNTTAEPHCLSRGFGRQENYPARFSGEKISPDAMRRTFEKTKFFDFSMEIEVGPHNSLPMNINGDFMLFEAPNDPVFFLHHVQMDRLWWLWQNQSPERALEYNGPKNGTAEVPEFASLDDLLPMHELSVDLPVRDLMKTTSGLLCYTY